MKILLIVLGVGLTAFIQGRQMVLEKNFRDLIIFLAFLTFAFALALVRTLGVELPSPTVPIEAVVKTFIDVNFGYQPEGE